MYGEKRLVIYSLLLYQRKLQMLSVDLIQYSLKSMKTFPSAPHSVPLSVAPYANHSLFYVSLQQNQHVSPKHIPLWNLIANLSKFLAFPFTDEAWLESRLELSKAGEEASPDPANLWKYQLLEAIIALTAVGLLTWVTARRNRPRIGTCWKSHTMQMNAGHLTAEGCQEAKLGESWPNLKWNHLHLQNT